MLPRTDGGRLLLNDGLINLAGVSGNQAVEGGEHRWRSGGLDRGRDRHSCRVKRAGGGGGDLDAFAVLVPAHLGAMVISIAATAGREFFFGGGQEHGRDQRKADGDQQQDNGRKTPHPFIVTGSGGG